MKNIKVIRFLSLTLMVLFSLNSALAVKPVYKADYKSDAVMQVFSLKENADGLYILIKNYQAKEDRLLEILWDGEKLCTQWEGPNFFEERSVVLLSGGKLRGQEEELLVLSNNSLTLINPDSKETVYAVKDKFYPCEIATGDVDGDKMEEIIFSKIEKTGLKYNVEGLVIYGWQKDRFVLEGEIKGVGNIRSICAADLDGDSKAEIIVEEGNLNKGGTLYVYHNRDGKWAVRTRQQLAKQAIWNMMIGPDSRLYYIAGGSIRSAVWNGQSFTGQKTCLETSTYLVAFSVRQLDEDKTKEVIAAGYPNIISIGKIE